MRTSVMQPQLGSSALMGACRRRLVCLCAVGLLLLIHRVDAEANSNPKFSPNATYTADTVGVVGGRKPGFVVLDNLDLTLLVRLEPLLGWGGGQLFVYALGNQGGSVSSLIGDVQTADNIEAPTNFSFLEAWYEQRFVGSRASILVGLYDINSEFDHLHSANLFINSSFGLNAVLGASGRNGPSSFPVTSLSARLKLLLTYNLYTQAAILDGVPGRPGHPRGTHVRVSAEQGVLLLWESGVLLGARERTADDETLAHARRRRAGRAGVGAYDFKFAGGNWWYSAPFDDLRQLPAAPSQARTNYGGYFALDAPIFRALTLPGYLAAHARVAFGNPRFNTMALNASAGLSHTGLIPGRSDDESGLGWSSVWPGRSYDQAARANGMGSPQPETVIEVTHLFSLSEWFSIQLDAQWIENPGMMPRARDAVMLLSRFQGAF